MKLGFLQLHITADVADNKRRLAEGIIDLAHRGAELIVLQELHNTLYFCQVEDVDNFDLAETIPGPSTDFYGKLAKDLGVVIVTSLFERRAPGLYHNTAVVIEKDGTIAGKYRKMHIPDDPAYYEKFYFTPGDLGFQPIQTSVGKLGVLVCWDQWYPEAARLMALQGAEILIYPTAIGYAKYDTEDEQQRQREAWGINKQNVVILLTAFLEHQDTGRDACAIEYIGRQTDDGIHIVLFLNEETAYYALGIATEQHTMRSHASHCATLIKVINHVKDKGIVGSLAWC